METFRNLLRLHRKGFKLLLILMMEQFLIIFKLKIESLYKVSPEVAKKYLARFDSFQDAVQSYLDSPSNSPIRAPDRPFDDILILGEPKTSLIHSTTDLKRSFRSSQDPSQETKVFLIQILIYY